MDKHSITILYHLYHSTLHGRRYFVLKLMCINWKQSTFSTVIVALYLAVCYKVDTLSDRFDTISWDRIDLKVLQLCA